MKMKKVVIGLYLLTVSLFAIAQINAVEEKKQAVVKPDVSVFDENKVKTLGSQLPGLDTKTEQVVEVSTNNQIPSPVTKEADNSTGVKSVEVTSPQVAIETKEVFTPASIVELTVEDLNNSEDPIVKEDIESIKKLFVSLNEVFVKKQSDRLSSFFTDKFLFIQSDQAVYKDFDSLTKYFFEKTKFEGFIDFAEISLQDKISASISFDGLTAQLVGKASEKYLIADSEYSIPLRWTAYLEKVDGVWKIKSLHFGADHLNNQILSGYESFGIKVGVIAAFVGLLIGMLLAGLILRMVKK